MARNTMEYGSRSAGAEHEDTREQQVHDVQSTVDRIAEHYQAAREKGNLGEMEWIAAEAAREYHHLVTGEYLEKPQMSQKIMESGWKLCRGEESVESLLYQRGNRWEEQEEARAGTAEAGRRQAEGNRAEEHNLQEEVREKLEAIVARFKEGYERLLDEAMASVELVGQEARALSGAGQAAGGRAEAESQGALSEEQAAGERQTSGESQAAGDDRATTGGNASEGAEEQPSEQERRSERRSGRYNLEAAAALSREYDYKAELTQWRLKGQEHGLTRGEEDFLARVTLGILENGEGDLESRKHRRLFVNGRVGINTLNYGRESREDLRDQALESYVHGYTGASTGSIGEAETFAKWLAKPMGGGESEKERLRNLVGNALWHTPSRAGPGDVEFDHAMDRIVEAVEDHDRATKTGEKRTFTYHNPSGRKNKWEELVEAVHAPDRASLETEVVNYRNLQRMEQARNEENLLLGLGKLALSSWANRVPGAVGEYVRGRHERRLERGYDFKLASNAEHQDAVEAKREERASEKFLESAEKLESAKRQVEALRETMREMLEKREEHSRTEIRQMREEQRKAERESRVAERAAEKHKLEFERAQRQVEYNARMKELALNDPKVVKLMGKHNP